MCLRDTRRLKMRKFMIKLQAAALAVTCSIGFRFPMGTVYASETGSAQTDMAAEREETRTAAEGWKAVEARNALKKILAQHEVMALVYLDATQSLWTDASFDSMEAEELPAGQTVLIRDALQDEDGVVWLYVETLSGGRTLQGYIPRMYAACADEEFLAWEQKYMRTGGAGISMYATSRDGLYADVEAFPESYRASLYSMKQKHPNWMFVKMDTGLWWDTVISEEMQGDRSWIYKTYPDYVKGEAREDGNWYVATEGILKYYMDPRNSLREDAVFQFELLTYNRTYHTEDAISAVLNNTFMNSSRKAPGTGYTFSQIFLQAGSEKNVSPFHLSARVYQEQGDGSSPLISGTYPGYAGLYNYFNVGATGKTTKEVIENGLKYAQRQKWTDAYLSIMGGTQVISANYISKGQDTIYLQKYNVNRSSPHGLYNHQYMQNIAAPTSEGKKVMEMYRKVGSLDNTFVFKIPVYEGMPASACPMPAGPGSDPDNGWREENGGKYWYENGVRQGTEGRGKEIYDPGTDAWYWLDAVDNGKMAVNKDVYQESYAGDYADRPDGTGKWVRYDENGRMVKGEDDRFGGWYRFDEVTGAMVKGWYTDANGRKYYYDRETGQMVHGYAVVDGQYLYFDYETGVFADSAWSTIDGADYWYEGGVKQGLEGRGKEIYDPGTDAWYWLDAVDGGKKAVSKDVYQESYAGTFADSPDGTGKWVRYDAEGHMVKGWDRNAYGTYYFDPETGAMAKGEVVIEGRRCYFNPGTGIQEW